MPTLCVFVIMTGPSRKPESSTHVVPVISPFPFSVNHPAKTGSFESLPRGRIAVTPVRTGPAPGGDAASPEMRVVCPTSTPLTSVIAFTGPGTPSKGIPKLRARGLVSADTKLVKTRDRKKIQTLLSSNLSIVPPNLHDQNCSVLFCLVLPTTVPRLVFLTLHAQ